MHNVNKKSLQTLGLQALFFSCGSLWNLEMVRPLGLEPRTHGLKVRYSTN